VALQPLLGFEIVQCQDSNPQLRTHLLARRSLLLLAQTGWLAGARDLLALTWVGKPSEEALPWLVASSAPGRLALQHPLLGSWIIESPELPVCSPANTLRPVFPEARPFSQPVLSSNHHP
jgi:hypothetical protein